MGEGSCDRFVRAKRHLHRRDSPPARIRAHGALTLADAQSIARDSMGSPSPLAASAGSSGAARQGRVAPAPHPRTTLEVAAAINLRAAVVHQLLRDEVERGNVQRVGGGWALTASAERRFGQALRDMPSLLEP